MLNTIVAYCATIQKNLPTWKVSSYCGNVDLQRTDNYFNFSEFLDFQKHFLLYITIVIKSMNYPNIQCIDLKDIWMLAQHWVTSWCRRLSVGNIHQCGFIHLQHDSFILYPLNANLIALSKFSVEVIYRWSDTQLQVHGEYWDLGNCTRSTFTSKSVIIEVLITNKLSYFPGTWHVTLNTSDTSYIYADIQCCLLYMYIRVKPTSIFCDSYSVMSYRSVSWITTFYFPYNSNITYLNILFSQQFNIIYCPFTLIK